MAGLVILLACAAIGIVLPSRAALAQAPARPGPAEVPVPSPGSPLPGVVPPQVPRLAPGLTTPPPPQPPSVAPEGATYSIQTVSVDGVTAFPQPAVAALTGGLTGPAVATSQIEASRRALVDLYRSHGYVYTTVRAIINGPELRFQVVEGYVAEVKLDGDVGPAGVQVLRFLTHVVGQVPLKTAELERWLLLAQDIPGLTVRSVLNSSLGDPGALTLIAQVSRRPVSGFVSADNRAFDLAGPEEGLGVLNFDSFTEFGERTQLSVFGAFNGTAIFGQVSEEAFLGGSGLKGKLYAGAGNSTPSDALAAIGYDGKTVVFGAQLSYPLLRTREQSLNLVANFDATESDVSNSLSASGESVRSSFDSLRTLRFGGDYALLDAVWGWERSAVNLFSGRLSQGLTILGASQNDDATSARGAIGQFNFTKFTFTASRNQTLFRPYTDASVALYVALAGQDAFGEVLPSSEKFYLGGPSFNRGYYYGQVSGDNALTLSAELRLNTPVPMPKPLPFEVKSQFYIFYDWGSAWQNTVTESDITLRSAGLGARLYIASATELDLEGAYRINLFPNGNGIGVSPANAAAFYWQIVQRF